MISLLIWYCCICHYFFFSSVPFPSLIHCHAPCQHDLMCEPLWLLMCNAHLCWILYQLLHWTSSPYLMDRWLIVLIATFLFLSYLMHPIAAWPIISHCPMWSCTYCSFISDEPCACFLDYHLYLTCLYLPYHPRQTEKNTEKSFSQSSDMGSSPSLINTTWSLMPPALII